SSKPVLEPLMRTGRAVGTSSSVVKARGELRSALEVLPAAYARLRHPARFPVGLTRALADLKAELVSMHAC
ncbi:MAG: nicotinate phosphoribosyltransferase, partial [Deltaproteobacteria bacterium HGW-Deltaproteobacteria-20]